MTAAERRARLVDAAIAVMCRDGMAAASTRAIVAEADMPIGSFHYCFTSKDELVLEVMRRLSDWNFGIVTACFAGIDDPVELVARALAVHWADVQESPERHLLTYELTQAALRQPGHEHVARTTYDDYFARMEQLLADMATAGGFTWRSPLPVLARYVFAAIEGITFQWLVSRDDEAAAQLLEEVAGHMVRAAGLAR